MEILKYFQEQKLQLFSDISPILQKEPFSLHVKEDGNLYLLKYDQIGSDFNLPLVREARGIILEKDTNRIICYPFNKFFNSGERYADKIDWDSAKIYEKIDGSIMKLYFYDKSWRIATNGVINAINAVLGKEKNLNYYNLFVECGKNLDYNRLNPEYTYMFELIHPLNETVISCKEPKLYHIGTRSIVTLQEIEVEIGIEKPPLFQFDSLETCLSTAKQLTLNCEGFVACDKNYNRVKIKGSAYIHAAYFRNKIISEEGAISIILNGEMSEFLSYREDQQDLFIAMEAKLDKFATEIAAKVNLINSTCGNDRKSFALAVANEPKFNYFKFFQKPVSKNDITIQCRQMPADKVLIVLKKFFNE